LGATRNDGGAGKAGYAKSLEKFFNQVLEEYKEGLDLECVAHVEGCWVGATQLLPSGQHGEVFYNDSLDAFLKKVKKEYEQGRRLHTVTFGDGVWLGATRRPC